MTSLDHVRGAAPFPALDVRTAPIPERSMLDDVFSSERRFHAFGPGDFDAPVAAADANEARAVLVRSASQRGVGGVVTRTFDDHGAVSYLAHPAKQGVPVLGGPTDPAHERLTFASRTSEAMPLAITPGPGNSAQPQKVNDASTLNGEVSRGTFATRYDRAPRWYHAGTPVRDAQVTAIGASSFTDVEQASAVAVRAATRNDLPAVVVSKDGRHTVALLDEGARDALEGARAVQPHRRFANAPIDDLRVFTAAGRRIPSHPGTITSRVFAPAATTLAIGSAAVLGVGLLLGVGLQVSNAAGSAKRQYDSGFGR